VGATAAGAAVSWLATALHYRTKVAAQNLQVQTAEQAKLKAQQLAVQARQQVESLQLALSEAKRDGARHTASGIDHEAAARAKVQARADLLHQLDAHDDVRASSHGFADTQPMSAG
jgi:hypothetical protein